MKAESGNLQALFDTGGPFCIANCYTIAPKSGSVIRVTDADVNVRTAGIFTWTKDGALIKRDKISNTLGLESSTISLTLMADDSILTSTGVPLIKAIGDGYLDGATIIVTKVFSADWASMPILTSTNKGWLLMFSGVIRDTKVSTNEAKIIVVSSAYKFETMLPLNSFGPSCSNILYDTKCGVNNASHTQTTTTDSAGATNFSFIVAGITADYLLGTVEFTAGPNINVKRTITGVDTGTGFITVSQPFPVQPAGETVRIYKGCDKKLTTCTTRFSNQSNFRGYPYVPNPESIA